jgi:hypothetical protein
LVIQDVTVRDQQGDIAFAQDLFTDQAKEVSRFKQMFNASSLKSTFMSSVQTEVVKGSR